MPARRTFPVLALAVMAAGLALTACDNGGGADDAAPSTATSSVAQSPTAEPDAPTGRSGRKCTDRLDYAGDPRPNAEINSIGDKTGTCPQPQSGGAAPSGTPVQDAEKCTDRLDYAGDPRPNAEINSIGDKTGTCPQPL
ncbi:hypothetical protein ABZ387_08830, partial [Streptomyces flaveolus]|uniref:hypothetical protein n=1 Tax=Streptomyces flaveolus TaxID=67297 RepID=UPI0033F8D3AD